MVCRISALQVFCLSRKLSDCLAASGKRAQDVEPDFVVRPSGRAAAEGPEAPGSRRSCPQSPRSQRTWETCLSTRCRATSTSSSKSSASAACDWSETKRQTSSKVSGCYCFDPVGAIWERLGNMDSSLQRFSDEEKFILRHQNSNIRQKFIRFLIRESN